MGRSVEPYECNAIQYDINELYLSLLLQKGCGQRGNMYVVIRADKLWSQNENFPQERSNHVICYHMNGNNFGPKTPTFNYYSLLKNRN